MCCDKDIVMTDSLAQDFHDYSTMLYGIQGLVEPSDKRREFIRGVFIADEHNNSTKPRSPVVGSKEPIIAIAQDRRHPDNQEHPWSMYLVVFCCYDHYQRGKTLGGTDTKFFHARVLADFEMVFRGISGFKAGLLNPAHAVVHVNHLIDHTLRNNSPTPEGLDEFGRQNQRLNYRPPEMVEAEAHETTSFFSKKKEPELKEKGVQEILPYSCLGNFWEGLKSMGGWCGTSKEYRFKNCTVVLSLSFMMAALAALGYVGYLYHTKGDGHDGSSTPPPPPPPGPGGFCPPFNSSAAPSFIPGEIPSVICGIFQPLIDLCMPFINIWGSCLNLDEMGSIFRLRFPNRSMPFTNMWTEYVYCTYQNPTLQQMMNMSLTQPWTTNMTLCMQLMMNETI
jgi:hypothetical protein